MSHKARRRSRKGMTCETADDVNMQEKGKETDGDRRMEGKDRKNVD